MCDDRLQVRVDDRLEVRVDDRLQVRVGVMMLSLGSGCHIGAAMVTSVACIALGASALAYRDNI